MKWLAALVIYLALPLQGWGACQPLQDKANNYTICQFDLRQDHLQLFNLDANGKPYGDFATLSEALKQHGWTLTFAMNAGMFGTDYRPIGLYIENGRRLHKINRANGKGNFALKPNGIMWIAGDKAGVAETEAFMKSGVKPDFATQSGPMLVINGAIHPKISEAGTSQKIRNGVGMIDDHTLVFAISDGFVTFHDFATLFRDTLNCRNALFLDGSISSLYAPELNRNDGFLKLGPMVGLVK